MEGVGTGGHVGKGAAGIQGGVAQQGAGNGGLHPGGQGGSLAVGRHVMAGGVDEVELDRIGGGGGSSHRCGHRRVGFCRVGNHGGCAGGGIAPVDQELGPCHADDPAPRIVGLGLGAVVVRHYPDVVACAAAGGRAQGRQLAGDVKSGGVPGVVEAVEKAHKLPACRRVSGGAQLDVDPIPLGGGIAGGIGVAGSVLHAVIHVVGLDDHGVAGGAHGQGDGIKGNELAGPHQAGGGGQRVHVGAGGDHDGLGHHGRRCSCADGAGVRVLGENRIPADEIDVARGQAADVTFGGVDRSAENPRIHSGFGQRQRLRFVGALVVQGDGSGLNRGLVGVQVRIRDRHRDGGSGGDRTDGNRTYGAGGQNAIEVAGGCAADCQSVVDGAGGGFQHPVAPQGRGARGVRGSRHVRPGVRRQIGDKTLAIRSRRHVTTVEQQVTAGFQRVAKFGQFGLDDRCRQGGIRQDICAQVQGRLVAMAENVDGVVTGMAARPLRHLGESVATDLDDAHAGADAGFQSLVIGDGGIDKHHFLMAVVLGRIRRAHFQRGRHDRNQCLGRGIRSGMGRILDDGGSSVYRGAVEHQALFQTHGLRGGTIQAATGGRGGHERLRVILIGKRVTWIYAGRAGCGHSCRRGVRGRCRR